MSIQSSEDPDNLQYGEHLAHLYEGCEAQMEWATALFRQGLAHGDKCVYFTGDDALDSVRELMLAELDLNRKQSGALVVARQWYGEGEDPAAVERRLDKLLDGALAQGFTGLRLIIDMTWALRVAPALVMERERRAGRWALRKRCILVCQYDTQKLSPELLQAALHTHPTVSVNGQGVPNPYTAPGELDAADATPGNQVQWMLRRLASATEEARIGHRRERQALFLTEASMVLGSSLDLNATFNRIAELAVPTLADWCIVDIVDETGQPRRVAVVHRDPDKLRRFHEVHRYYPPREVYPVLLEVIGSGQPAIKPEIPDAELAGLAHDPDHLAQLRSFGWRSVMMVPLVTRGRVLGAITLTSAESGRRYDHGDLTFAESLARIAAMAVENSRLYEEAQRQSREALALEAVAREITSSLDSDQVFQRIVEHARELCAADIGCFAICNLVTNEARVQAVSGNRAEVLPSFAFRAGATPVCAMVTSGQVQVCEDIRSDPRFAIGCGDGSGITREWHDTLGSEGIVAKAMVPVQLHGSITGMLWVGQREVRHFSEREVAILTRLADQAAIALENSRLYAQASQLAAHRERLRVANELHDTLSQLLFSIGLKLDWCLHKLSRRSKGRQKLEEIRTDTGIMMEQLRNLIAEHSTDDTTRRSLAERIGALAAQFQELTGTVVRLRDEAKLSALDEPAQDIVYKALREALANVAKHANAAHVTIRLSRSDEGLTFEVIDDGVGTAPAGSPAQPWNDSPHFGLRQMAERIEAVGGRLEAGPADRSGFRLAGTLPIRNGVHNG